MYHPWQLSIYLERQQQCVSPERRPRLPDAHAFFWVTTENGVLRLLTHPLLRTFALVKLDQMFETGDNA